MSENRWWCYTILAALLAFPPSEVRAESITPDSLPTPLGSVGSQDSTPIYSASDLVTTQYKQLGLSFSSAGGSLTAITNLNGAAVWAPAVSLAQPDYRIAGGPQTNWPVAQIHYSGTWSGGYFVLPGTLTPTAASSVTLEIIGRPVAVDLFNSSGGLLGSATPVGLGPHGGQLYTFTGSGISSFSVVAPVIDPPGIGFMPINPAWGVAEVSFTLAHTPEPSSLVLAGLGILTLVGSLRRARLSSGRDISRC